MGVECLLRVLHLPQSRSTFKVHGTDILCERPATFHKVVIARNENINKEVQVDLRMNGFKRRMSPFFFA